MKGEGKYRKYTGNTYYIFLLGNVKGRERGIYGLSKTMRRSRKGVVSKLISNS